jgi:hypothetical protein
MTDTTPDGQSAAADEADHLQAAARIRREHPGWVVIWVARTGRYHAYPLFRTPRGTAVTAATPDELAAQMDRIRQAARSPRARSPDLDGFAGAPAIVSAASGNGGGDSWRG